MHTSKSKSKRSPASIWVVASKPALAGMKRGVEGRSLKGSVWVDISAAATVSVNCSK